MTYETYIWLSYICAGLSVVMLIVSIFLFFKLKIFDVIGDLTGSKAKRAIKDINEQNASKTNSRNKVSKTHNERSKITEKITQSGNLERKNTSSGFQMETEKLDMNNRRKNNIVSNETTVLDMNKNDLTNNSQNETTVLTNTSRNDSVNFNIEYEITYTHATERIL